MQSTTQGGNNETLGQSEYTELYDLMEQAKRYEVVEDDDFKMTIDYQNMTSIFEVK